MKMKVLMCSKWFTSIPVGVRTWVKTREEGEEETEESDGYTIMILHRELTYGTALPSTAVPPGS